MKTFMVLVGCLLLVGASHASACSGNISKALPNTTASGTMAVKRGHPCGRSLLEGLRRSTLTVTGFALYQEPRLGTVTLMQPVVGFQYLSHRAGRDRFKLAIMGLTSFKAPYTIIFDMNVRVTD